MPAGSKLEWSIGEERGSLSAPAVEPLGVEPCGELGIALPSVEAAVKMELHLRLLGPEGDELAVNRVSFAVHPRLGRRHATVASDDPALSQRFSALGYGVAQESEADVFVTRSLTTARVEAIRLGQKVLLLAERGNGHLRHDAPPREQPHTPIVDDIPGIPSQPYFSFPGYSLTNRDGTIWRGDWVTNFSWIRRSGPFAALPGGPMLDLTFDRVIPRDVISGFRPWEFDGRVHGAVVVGWIQKLVATIIEKRLGGGKLVANDVSALRGSARRGPDRERAYGLSDPAGAAMKVQVVRSGR